MSALTNMQEAIARADAERDRLTEEDFYTWAEYDPQPEIDTAGKRAAFIAVPDRVPEPCNYERGAADGSFVPFCSLGRGHAGFCRPAQSLTRECFEAGTDWMPQGWSITEVLSHLIVPGFGPVGNYVGYGRAWAYRQLHLRDGDAPSFRDDDK